MADVELAILNRLSTTAAITNQVGDRIYPHYVRQADRTTPYLVYKVGITPEMAFDGPVGVERATLQIAAVTDTEPEAVALSKLIQTAFDGQRGTWAGLVVQGCFVNQGGIEGSVLTEPTTEQIINFIRSLAVDVIYSV